MSLVVVEIATLDNAPLPPTLKVPDTDKLPETVSLPPTERLPETEVAVPEAVIFAVLLYAVSPSVAFERMVAKSLIVACLPAKSAVKLVT